MSEHPPLMRFLLVEDDDDHAELTVRAMKRARVVNSVVRVRDGVEAMAYLRREGEFAARKRPDVMLLDLKLPRMNGLEVLQEVRSDENLRSLPVVILTTSGEAEDLETAYDLHVNSYIKKPIDFEQFRKLADDLSLYWGLWNRVPPADEDAE